MRYIHAVKALSIFNAAASITWLTLSKSGITVSMLNGETQCPEHQSHGVIPTGARGDDQ
jgi:hypothetical protein